MASTTAAGLADNRSEMRSMKINPWSLCPRRRWNLLQWGDLNLV